MQPDTSQVITVAGGRRFGYAEYGDPSGRPVLYFHGMPGSHVEARAFDAAGTACGARILAIDRPGIGASSVAGHRRLSDWPGQVAAFAELRGLDRFAVLGVSGGGPYAASCAHALGDRLTGVALVSAIAPLPTGPVPEELDEAARRHYSELRTLRRFPVLARLAAARLAHRARTPVGGLAAIRESMAAVDRDRIDASPRLARDLSANLRKAFRQGSRGFATDLRVLFARPWGFRPADITVPVHLWHGERDANVPVADGRALAAAIPTCHAEFVPGAGHLLFLDWATAILSALIG